MTTRVRHVFAVTFCHSAVAVGALLVLRTMLVLSSAASPVYVCPVYVTTRGLYVVSTLGLCSLSGRWVVATADSTWFTFSRTCCLFLTALLRMLLSRFFLMPPQHYYVVQVAPCAVHLSHAARLEELSRLINSTSAGTKDVGAVGMRFVIDSKSHQHLDKCYYTVRIGFGKLADGVIKASINRNPALFAAAFIGLLKKFAAFAEVDPQHLLAGVSHMLYFDQGGTSGLLRCSLFDIHQTLTFTADNPYRPVVVVPNYEASLALALAAVVEEDQMESDPKKQKLRLHPKPPVPDSCRSADAVALFSGNRRVKSSDAFGTAFSVARFVVCKAVESENLKLVNAAQKSPPSDDGFDGLHPNDALSLHVLLLNMSHLQLIFRQMAPNRRGDCNITSDRALDEVLAANFAFLKVHPADHPLQLYRYSPLSFYTSQPSVCQHPFVLLSGCRNRHVQERSPSVRTSQSTCRKQKCYRSSARSRGVDIFVLVSSRYLSWGCLLVFCACRCFLRFPKSLLGVVML